MRQSDQDHNPPQSSWSSLPPLHTAPHLGPGVGSTSLATSPTETTSSGSNRTLSVSDAGTISSVDDHSALIRAQTGTAPSGLRYEPAQHQILDEDDEDDEGHAQRKSLIPGGPVIPPMYEFGPHVDMKQKQNCGRRTAKADPEEYEVSDPNRKKAFSKRNDHTNAERNRRNDHKNLTMDLYLQTPSKFLYEAGWSDQAKEPVKKVILEAAVSYLHDLSKTCTRLYESDQRREREVVARDNIIAHQREEIRVLKAQLQEQRRPSVTSTIASTVPDLSASSSFRSEPPTPDGREMHSFMEPRVPPSGPATPAFAHFSLRSSPLPRSRPASRPSSPPKTLLPCPIASNTDFQFPSQPKRKPDEPWVFVHKDIETPQTSPKRARFHHQIIA